MTRRLLVLASALLATATVTAQRGPNILSRIDSSTDLPWLEQLATDHDAARTVARPYSPKAVRSRSYIRLAAIATPESIAVARRIETAARGWPLLPATVALDDMPHPSGHVSSIRLRELLAQIRMPDGLTYAVLHLPRLAGLDLFLTTTRTPQDVRSWSRPLLIPGLGPYGAHSASLTRVSDRSLRLDVDAAGRDERGVQTFFPAPEDAVRGPQSWTIDLDAIRADEDGDGWTDLEERRLQLNPGDSDTDDDGVPDGRDVTPNHAASPTEPGDEEAAVLRKVFFAAIGIHGSHDVLMVRGTSRPVQLWGSRGPVLYGVDRSAWINDVVLAPLMLNWRLTALESDGPGPPTATVSFEDYLGPLAAGGYTVTLRRIEGEWFVVDIQMNWIS